MKALKGIIIALFIRIKINKNNNITISNRLS